MYPLTEELLHNIDESSVTKASLVEAVNRHMLVYGKYHARGLTLKRSPIL